MSKAIFFGSYGHKDLGDDAHLLATISIIRKEKPDTELTVLAYDPEIYQKRYSLETDYALLFNKLNKRSNNFLKYLNYLILFPQPLLAAVMLKYLKVNISFNRQIRSILRHMYSSNVIIASGGRMINEDFKKSVITYLYLTILAKIINKPIIYLGQSLGPFYSKSFKFLCSRILNFTETITVRDQKSKDNLAELKVNRPLIKLTGDSGMLLVPAKSEKIKLILDKEQILRDRPLIGISVRKWIYPRDRNSKEKHSTYVKVLAETADGMIDKFHARVIFLSTMTSELDDDRKTAIEIFKLMKFKSYAKVITNEYTAGEAKGIIGSMDMFIGTRFHSLVFATTMCVPSICISPTFKNEEYMRLIGQGDLVCKIEEIGLERMNRLIDLAWGSRNIVRSNLMTQVKVIQERVLENLISIVRQFI